MITYQTEISQNIEHCKPAQTQVSQSRAKKIDAKLENRHFWFFFGVAPLSVMVGWSLVGLSLTGDWAWELPLGLLFAFIASMAAMLSTLLRF